MRVAQVLGPSTGGIGAYVRDLSEHCVRAGDTVLVLGPAATGEHFDFAATGARFRPLGLGTLRRLSRQCDVVHAHGYKAAALVGLALLGTRGGGSGTGRRPRRVVTLHNALEPGAPSRAQLAAIVERWALRSADLVLGASADLVLRARDMGAVAEFCPVPAAALPAPGRTRAETRERLGVGDEDVLLLSVGRLAAQKSFPVLLSAVADLEAATAASVRLFICGEGPERARLEARIADQGLPVTLLGHRTDIAELLAAADVFVLASRWEARSLAVQEALRAGVPLVVTAVGALPELVGDAALLVPWNDERALAEALGKVIGDSELRRRLSDEGPVRAASWPTSTEALDAARGRYR